MKAGLYIGRHQNMAAITPVIDEFLQNTSAPPPWLRFLKERTQFHRPRSGANMCYKNHLHQYSAATPTAKRTQSNALTLPPPLLLFLNTVLNKRTQFPNIETAHKLLYFNALRYIPLARKGTRRTQFRPTCRPCFRTSFCSELRLAAGKS
jgi:hypothetical protein